MRFGYKQQSSAEAELCVSILNTLYSVLNTILQQFLFLVSYLLDECHL